MRKNFMKNYTNIIQFFSRVSYLNYLFHYNVYLYIFLQGIYNNNKGTNNIKNTHSVKEEMMMSKNINHLFHEYFCLLFSSYFFFTAPYNGTKASSIRIHFLYCFVVSGVYFHILYTYTRINWRRDIKKGRRMPIIFTF